MLHERLGFSPDVIEAQLAHSVRDSLGRAYNRTEFIEQRRDMLQQWADYLDDLRANVEGGQRKGKRVEAKPNSPKALRSTSGRHDNEDQPRASDGLHAI
jgi:hypothetical protein